MSNINKWVKLSDIKSIVDEEGFFDNITEDIVIMHKIQNKVFNRCDDVSKDLYNELISSFKSSNCLDYLDISDLKELYGIISNKLAPERSIYSTMIIHLDNPPIYSINTMCGVEEAILAKHCIIDTTLIKYCSFAYNRMLELCYKGKRICLLIGQEFCDTVLEKNTDIPKLIQDNYANLDKVFSKYIEQYGTSDYVKIKSDGSYVNTYKVK